MMSKNRFFCVQEFENGGVYVVVVDTNMPNDEKTWSKLAEYFEIKDEMDMDVDSLTIIHAANVQKLEIEESDFEVDSISISTGSLELNKITGEISYLDQDGEVVDSYYPGEDRWDEYINSFEVDPNKYNGMTNAIE